MNQNNKDIQIVNKLCGSSMTKETFIGLMVSIIIKKSIFTKNNDTSDFINKVFDIELPFYIVRSRTLMAAKICRILIDCDSKNLKKYQSLVKYDLSERFNNTSHDENQKIKRSKGDDGLSNMNKWIDGILNKEG
ncbi:hypothetical protein [Photobacterium kishitanii]|uniref:hypothetical protein n=1 Tax=Photobacterium kishitanii TaxID=318456 RepID=UPI000D15C386|nr:hypothetical protein [Photobacterium kishitanii]PSW47066.1 hypothetical protein C0W66_20120 [Photobacterium kishitanii]